MGVSTGRLAGGDARRSIEKDCSLIKPNVGNASSFRQHFLQSALNAVQFFPNDANGLLVSRRVRVRRDGFERRADLVVAVPDQMQFRDSATAVLEHVPYERGREPGEDEAEEGLDRKPVFGAIIVGKEQSVDRFAHSKRRENNRHADEENGKQFEGPTDRWITPKPRPH